jgi:hypothetical protein
MSHYKTCDNFGCSHIIKHELNYGSGTCCYINKYVKIVPYEQVLRK